MRNEDIKVGDVVDGLFVISICDGLLMCEGTTAFDRGEEEESEEGCPIGNLKDIELWERYEQDWTEEEVSK